eukprot:1155502-Pelagomonas_calceolata.AAC.4
MSSERTGIRYAVGASTEQLLSLHLKNRRTGLPCFLLQVRIVKHAFEIISLLTDQNPVQTLVDAIINRCALGQEESQLSSGQQQQWQQLWLHCMLSGRGGQGSTQRTSLLGMLHKTCCSATLGGNWCMAGVSHVQVPLNSSGICMQPQ